MAKVVLSDKALRKEYESLEWENAALRRTIGDFEEKLEISWKKDKFMKIEVDMQKKIQNQDANLRMSVKELLQSRINEPWKRLSRYKVVNYFKPKFECQLPQRRLDPPVSYSHNSSIFPVKECENASFIKRMTQK